LIAISSETTTALIAAGAVLGGVLVGGLTTLVTTAYFERRRDRADSRQARRLVAEELRSIWNHLDLMAEEKEYPSTLPTSPSFLPSGQWEANRAALARHLGDKTWDALSPFMDSIPATRAIVELQQGAGQVFIPPVMLTRIEDARDLAADLYPMLTGGGSVDASPGENQKQ
jgi:hypothetical protein